MSAIVVLADARPRSTASLVTVAAATYLVLGWLGISLTIPPGFASPLFPAAGFAVAVMLWSGNRAWPGILLGSALLNLGIAWQHGELGYLSALIACGIASGAALQAFVASWLVARVLANAWQWLEQDRDIFRCLVLAGPLASVVSATTGVVVLLLARVIVPEAAQNNWWTWWTGDTLGVLIVTPLSLAVLYGKHSPWRERLLSVAVPMLIVLGLVAGAFFTAARWERAQQKAQIQDHGEALAQLLKQRFIAHQEAISALRRLIEVTPAMSYRQFEYFTQITLRDNPDIFALSFNPYVVAAERKAFERDTAARSGIPGFEIKERDRQRRLVRAADRAEYVTVGFIAPLAGNAPAIGYDINSEPVRHAAIERAKTSRVPAVTAPIQLVQENQKRVGVLVLHPAYKKEFLLSDAEQTPALIGFAVAVIKVDEMVEIATRTAVVEGLGFSIEDAEASALDRTIYQSPSTATPGDPYYRWRTQVRMADRDWNLSVMPSAAYLQQKRSWAAWAVGVTGLTLAALLQVLLLVSSGRTSIVQRKVKEQTEELHARADALQDRGVQLDALFSLSPDGFVVFGPDGRVKFTNPAFHTMTGIAPEDISGKPEAALEGELRRRAEQPELFKGISPYFPENGATPKIHLLALQQPRPSVLQLIGIHSVAASVSRILYLRDVTHEAEVDRMKSEFLSHAAHELRTPMASIFGFSELLLEMDLDEATRRDLLETIHRQTHLLVEIINELLDLARIEARRGKDFTITEVDLTALVRDTVADLAFDAERWPVNLDLPAQETKVLADASKVRQALVNVLGNGQKYSPVGGALDVAIKTSPAGFIGIAVEDHGIGMTEEQIGHVGQRFWRADTSGKTPGTGLGMAIVKEILELHGGHIEVHSRQKTGTSITLWFPVMSSALSLPPVSPT
ncbi:MAG: CHASE domain-containing protein [Proteobacteria bacterium]|nr:CHASE domain-containing protein [Pseudomonadota bacterium]